MVSTFGNYLWSAMTQDEQKTFLVYFMENVTPYIKRISRGAGKGDDIHIMKLDGETDYQFWNDKRKDRQSKNYKDPFIVFRETETTENIGLSYFDYQSMPFDIEAVLIKHEEDLYLIKPPNEV